MGGSNNGGHDIDLGPPPAMSSQHLCESWDSCAGYQDLVPTSAFVDEVFNDEEVSTGCSWNRVGMAAEKNAVSYDSSYFLDAMGSKEIQPAADCCAAAVRYIILDSSGYITASAATSTVTEAYSKNV